MGDKIFTLLLSGNTYCNTDYRFDIEFFRSRSNTLYAYISGKNLKDEYEKRYRNRGNTEGFRDIFIGQWEFRIEELGQKNSSLAKHIVLQEGQYLSDVINCVSGCDVYKAKQIEKFRQKLYQLQNNTLKGITVKEENLDSLDDEEISAVFYLKPICEDDIVTDFVWISSKRQLCKLLEQYKHDDFRTIPELLFLKLSYTESGIRCIETTR